MSVIIYSDPFEYLSSPSILDQHLVLDVEPEDFVTPLIPKKFRQWMKWPLGYNKSWKSLASQDVGSAVNYDKDKFQANLDVQQFAPNEISVKITGDNTITVEGKHEEKRDEHGFISRQFVRRYVLPEGHDVNKVVSKLSSDGVLTITAPKTDVQSIEHRNIPITQTGEPLKSIEKK